MELTTDASLKGPIWAETLDKLKGTIFDTFWDTFALSISIGMMYDAQIESDAMVPADYEAEPRTVPRNVLGHAQNKALLEFMLQTALVTTKHLDLSEEQRLELAFGNEKKLEFNAIAFLTKFANFGVKKIHEVITGTEDVETLEQLMTFLNTTYEAGVGVMDDDVEIDDDSDLDDFGEEE